MLSLSIHSNQKWKCPTCASNNQSNRNVIPCRNCHILQSDNNLKRANELFLLKQIILPSAALIPLKIPFFIYPLAPLFILQHSVQYKGTAASINLEIELWDNRHIENYHIESIKIVSSPTIGNSYTTSNTVINNKTPYCKQFVYHINNYKCGFHIFDIYAKCYGSTRISPKKALQITLLPLANTNLSFANNKQTTKSITLSSTNKKRKSSIANTDTKPLVTKRQRTSLSTSNTSATSNILSTSNTLPILVINNESKQDSDWYFKNDSETFEPTYNQLSKTIEKMLSGQKKIVKCKSSNYSITKIAFNKCIQENILTKKKRELGRNNWKWHYQDDDTLFKPYCDPVLTKLIPLEVGKSLQFTLGKKKKTYTFTKLSYNTGIQKNLSTGFERNAVMKKIYDVNKDIKKNKHIIDHNSPFKSHLSYLEAVTLSIGDKVDVRDVVNGYMFKGKIINIKLKKNNSEKCIKIHYDGFDAKYDAEINIDKKFEHGLYKLAKYESITTRQSQRLKNLKIGDFVDINPIYFDPGWKYGNITQIHSGQIEVAFIDSTKKELTKYWVHLDNSIECAELSKGIIDEKQVEALFFATVSFAKYSVIEIKDISNKDHITIYESILSQKCKINKCEIFETEKYLWHGTGNGSVDDTLNLILKNGFDRSYNKVGIYGKGTYFAKNASYSVSRGYCNKDKYNVYFILLCRVIVGEYVAGNKNMKTIPKKEDGTEYESLVNNKDNPTIFVSWRDFMAVPQYLIKFKCL